MDDGNCSAHYIHTTIPNSYVNSFNHNIFTSRHFFCPTAQKFTFLSSPPVTKIWPDLWPNATQFTLSSCAVNSSYNNTSHKQSAEETQHLLISAFVLLYNSMVRSHLDYCNSVWAPYMYMKRCIEVIERVQKESYQANSCTKLIPALQSLSYTDQMTACPLIL